MLSTKDIGGYLAPLATQCASLTAVSIPDEAATLPADVTAQAAKDAGFDASVAASVEQAITEISTRAPRARILICGSLYLAGHIKRLNAPA